MHKDASLCGQSSWNDVPLCVTQNNTATTKQAQSSTGQPPRWTFFVEPAEVLGEIQVLSFCVTTESSATTHRQTQVERQLLHVTDSATLQLDHDDMTTAMNEDPGPDLV